MATQLGRLLIHTEGAVRSLDCTSEEERDEFAAHLANTVEERIRQQLLVWRAGRTTAQDLATAQAADKARRKSV